MTNKAPTVDKICGYWQYRRLPQSPKHMLNVLIQNMQRCGSRVVTMAMKDLASQCGYTSSNVRKRLADNRKVLVALRFLKIVKGKSLGNYGSTPMTYEWLDDWMKLTREEYDAITNRSKRKRKEEADKRHQERMQTDPEYREEHRPSMTMHDILEQINMNPIYRRFTRKL